MARRLSFNGTGSGEGGCPAVHEDLDTGEVVVQGAQVTDPDDLAQLQHFDPEHEVAVVVPRNTLVDFGPRDDTPRIIDLTAFGKLFENFQHTAWRLETRRRYASDEEGEDYQQFLRGERPDWDMDSPWCHTIRRQVAQGARIERVRIVDQPATDGQRFLLAYAEKNSALGEDIRNLSRAGAQRWHLPDEDFWIFDSRLVAKLNFDDADNLVDVELITEPAVVNRHLQVRDAAWHDAIPYEQFAVQITAKE